MIAAIYRLESRVISDADKRLKYVGTKGVSQVYHLSFDDNKVLKNYQLDLLNIYSSVQDH